MDKLSTHQLHKFLHILPGFTQQARILLAVSGGVDSVVMTYLLASANYTIGIAHVNFQLRDGDAEKDEAFVKNLATSLNVPFFTTSVDTKKYASANKLSIEEAARNIRYQWLEEIRIQNNYDFIATAHHLNDHAETMLMHLTSGTGLQGMHGIRARNG
ncbi:MAG TPA: tRNA lysidine(34) synthetase TilS, partial [Chitinophagales bacterium]|nr:tRNA lysidine(34) synthetase TilS [Chitinophagales bacterium]